jgi:hypothetical protein
MSNLLSPKTITSLEPVPEEPFLKKKASKGKKAKKGKP